MAFRRSGVRAPSGPPCASTCKVVAWFVLLSSLQALICAEGSAGVTQLVEYHVANVTVAGSSPVSRSKSAASKVFVIGGVAKWSKAEVCKISIQRFESARRLQKIIRFAGVVEW